MRSSAICCGVIDCAEALPVGAMDAAIAAMTAGTVRRAMGYPLKISSVIKAPLTE